MHALSIKNHVFGLLCAVVSSVVFGLIPLFSLPLINSGMAVTSIVCYRFAISTLIMFTLLKVMRVPLIIEWRQAILLLLFSVFYALTALLLTASYKYIPTGISTTIHFLYPVWVTLLTVCLFKEKIAMSTIIPMIVAVVGVALLSFSSHSEKSIEPKGLIMVLGTVVTYGSYLVCLPKSNLKTMSGLKITFWLMFFCTILFSGVTIFTKGWMGFSAVPNGKCWLNLILVALLPTLVSNLTLIQAVKRVGPTITSVLGSLEPLTALLVGVIVFKEHCMLQQIIGVVVVIFSVSLLIFLKSNYKEKNKIKYV